MQAKPQTARTLAQVAMLKPPATDHLDAALNVQHFIKLLIDHKLWHDTVNFMSHAIPAREGIWWAWYCTKQSFSDIYPDDLQKGMLMVEQWIAQPTEEHRLAAKKYAQRIDPMAAVTAVLEAISATGKMEDPLTGATADPLPFFPAKFINAAVMIAAYTPKPEDPESVFIDYIKQGLEVANRIQVWSQYESEQPN